MYKFNSEIEYNDRRILAEIHSAKDNTIREGVASTIAMIIDLDQELQKINKQKDTYKIIQAHANNRHLYEKGDILISKDDASYEYDIINACNPELWIPNKNSIVKAYALGKIKSHEIPRHETYQDIDITATIEGEGHFMINNKSKKKLNIGGTCYQYNEENLLYEEEGIKKIKITDMWNFSK